MHYLHCFIFIFFYLFSCASQAQSFTASVLREVFALPVPDSLFASPSIPKLEALVHAHASSEPGEWHSGIVRPKPFSSPVFWLYRMMGNTQGVFALWNDRLEVIYLNNQMGQFEEVALKDLMDAGYDVLMVSHRGGGTGRHTTLTDLLIFNQDIPEWKGSIVKNATHADLRLFQGTAPLSQAASDAIQLITCKSKLHLDAKKHLHIETITTIPVNQSQVSATTWREVEVFLAARFHMQPNAVLTQISTVIEDLKLPIIQHFPALCEGFLFQDRPWDPWHLEQ